jgi:hypothetical protein
VETFAQRLAREQKELDQALPAALAHGTDAEVRAALEDLAAKYRWVFAGTLPRWGPALYLRNRPLFRGLVLSAWDGAFWGGGWKAADVDAILAEADRADDVEVFRRAYVLKMQLAKPKDPGSVWSAELLRRYKAAPSPQARAVVLEKLPPQWSWALDERTALQLYATDPLSRDFLLRHGPGGWRGEGWWGDLQKAAAARGDEDFRLALWRRQVDKKAWRAEALALCDRVRDPDALLEALEERHPEKALDLGDVFAELLEKRGEDVLGYVTPRVSARPRWWGNPVGYDALRGLSEKNGWWALWAAVMARVATAQQWNAEVKQLAGGAAREPEARRRLSLLASAPHALADDVALALYRRFPDLTTAFRERISGYGSAYRSLVDEAVSRGDDDVLDLLASKFVLHAWGKSATADRLADVYEGLKGTPAFARRAGAVLGGLPAYAVWRYDDLVRNNRLARLLFERTPSQWLEDGAPVRDLLESPQIHVQVLALRVLALDDDRARKLAAENADLLVPMLLRKLHSRTRVVAFGALANAASDPAVAPRVLAKAREALDLPDVRYPREKLIGLIGGILHRHPSLRGEREIPRVFA